MYACGYVFVDGWLKKIIFNGVRLCGRSSVVCWLVCLFRPKVCVNRVVPT